MKISTIIGAVSTALLMAASASAYDFTPFDWKAAVESGQTTVSISGNKAYLVTEADMQYLNKCTVSVSQGSYLVLSNATTACGSIKPSGSSGGTIVKMGLSRQEFKSGLNGFNGAFVVEEGTAVYTIHYAFGDPGTDYSSYGYLHPTVEVRAGATAEIAHNSAFYIRAFHIAGTGVDGKGAVVLKSTSGSGLIQKLYLDDDAYVASEIAGDVVQGRNKASSGLSAKVNPAILELNGHTLTLGGTSTRIGISGCKVTDSVGTGRIVYEAAANGERVVQFTGTNTVCSVPITFEGDTRVRFYNACAPIDSPITANGSLTFTYACDSGAGVGLTDAWNVWRGDIAFANDGSVLDLNPSGANNQLTVLGTISGDANVTFGATDASASGVVRLGGHNTYTGTTTLNGTSDLKVVVDHDVSIPDMTKLTVNGGVAVPRVVSDGEGGYTWTPSAYLDYVAPQVSETTGAKVPVDVTALTDGEFTFSGDEIATKLADAAGLVWSAFGSGSGRYTLTGPFADNAPLNLNIPAGTVRLTGEEPIRLGTTLVTGTAANQGGTLLLDGAADVSFGTDSIFLGNESATTPNTLGTMVVSNTYLHATVGSTPNDETGSIWVGHRTQGILRIEDGAVVSNGLCVGGSPSKYSATVSRAGVGAVYQRGGTVYPRATSAVGVGNHGYYELLDGSVVVSSGCGLTIGYGHSAFGIWMQYGGAFRSTVGLNVAQDNNYNTAVIYLKDGPFEVSGGSMTASYADGNHTTLTVDGPDAFFLNANQTFYCNNSGSGTLAVNLNNGGVFQNGYFQQMVQASDANRYSVLVNFNGGVWRRCWFYDNPFSEGAAKAHLAVKVYEKGVCFDTYYPGNIGTQAAGGKTINTTGANIEGAVGDGIQSIALPEGGLPGYIAAPYVKIDSTDANAYGATAVAEIDSETATVTNILVTSHGWGYTPEKTTVTLCYNSSVMYTIPKANVMIGPNTVGGLTKIGAGTLNVYGTNTWAQWTRVDAGTLAVKTNGSIPEGTELVLNGGTLDLGGFDTDAERPTTFSGIAGTGGTVQNGIVKVVGEWEISAKKFLDRETTVLKGTLDLTACTKIVLTDTNVLDETAEQLKRLELFKTTSTTWPENLVIEGVPQGWSMKQTATGLKLGFDRGMLLILR